MSRKSTDKSTASGLPVGALIPQPHGGAIRNGGTNVGGTGRPRSALRDRLTGSFEDRITVLEHIADGKVEVRLVGVCEACGHEGDPLTLDEIKAATPAIADRLKAIDLMGKYGPGSVKELSADVVRDKLTQTIRIISEALAPEQAEALLVRIEPVWK